MSDKEEKGTEKTGNRNVIWSVYGVNLEEIRQISKADLIRSHRLLAVDLFLFPGDSEVSERYL